MKLSPSHKRQQTLKVFFAYCCETYKKKKLEGDDKLLQQVYNIIAKMHGEGYMELFYGTTRNNGIYLKALHDFCQTKQIKGGRFYYCWVFRNWKIRQASNEIIKLIYKKL
jgi:hypothetical protein